MKKFIPAILILLLICNIFAEDSENPIDGYWEGLLEFQGFDLNFSVEFATIGENDSIMGLMDIPKQDAFGLNLQNILFVDDSLYFEYDSPIGLAVYAGTYDEYDNNIMGTFKQNNIEGTFELTRPVEKEMPFFEVDVRLELKDVILSGTLTLPDTVGQFPAALLVTGSGSQNRDEQMGRFRPFWTIAMNFANAGIATLRFDDPGIGFSEIKGDTKEFAMNVTTEDFADHAWEEFKYLRKHENIDDKKCGILGHSEGGIIASMLAAKSKKVKFAILMATPAMPGSTIIVDQIEMMMKGSGASKEDLERELQLQRLISKAVTEGDIDSRIEDLLREDIAQNMELLPLEALNQIEDSAKYVEEQLEIKMTQIEMAWTKFYMSYDPKEAIKDIRCPTLAIFAEKDMQVNPILSKDLMEKTLENAPTEEYKTITIEDANHHFQPVIIREDGSIKKRDELMPGFTNIIIKWLQEQFPE
ncbi:MAG: alpha/beta hydrolase family protein [Candidatus Zixiibacteriota bacterium]